MSFPVPENEEARLQALHAYKILDTPRDERFDRIARLVADQLDMPMAFVTLIDRDRQWIKACVGSDLEENPRAEAMCAHTILSTEVLVAEDPLNDPRFRDNPLVCAEDGIRFYAGAPLITRDGQALGSLCAVDTRARTIDERGRRLLAALASVVMDEVELHAAGMLMRTQAEELEEAHQRVLDLNRELEHFVHAAAHDLRAPLRTVDAFSTILIEQLDPETQPEPVDMATRIRTAATRLSDLTDALLVYARVRSSHPLAGRVELGETVASVLADLDSTLKEHGTQVELDELPAVVGVDSRLSQLFQNLITNAVKFRRPDTPCRISFTAKAVDGMAEIRVQDNGRGFDPRFAEAVFEPFRRLQRAEAGTGLGLTLCRQIARDAGGDMRAEANPDQGACFIVTLPLADHAQ